MDQLPTPNAKDDPDAALAAVVALRRFADQLEREAVLEALARGWSWARVAQALGVSKQAVHKRFASLRASHLNIGDD